MVYLHKHTHFILTFFIRVRHYLHRALGLNVALILLIAVLYVMKEKKKT